MRQAIDVYKRVLDMRDTIERMAENVMGDLSQENVRRFLRILDAMDVFLAPKQESEDRAFWLSEDTCGDCGVGAGEHANDCPRVG